jgi:DNA (cytosine-5)-methyltransferase 1
LKIADIFCGAGGFSEGFRQAGFEIIFGVDRWEPAVLTHCSNHPGTTTILDDVIRISTLPDDEFEETVPDSEIIIGSPPCVSFSNSNRSGKGDKDEGIILIKAFFRIVARKKWKGNSILKYWIMENVPNSRNFIQDQYSAQDLGLNGRGILHVKNGTSKVYSAANFGVPSRRERYFCGEFPEPERTVKVDEDIIHLREVLEALGGPNEKRKEKITDPNYDFFLPGDEVTDQHYVKNLARHQWKKAKRLKEDKGYMGKMAFPENLDRSARTIMATMTFGARESMIFGNGKGSYRAPTIREVASLMSFPIDYKFYGKSIGLKYRLVGNAVPPKMAFAFAKAIAIQEGLVEQDKYIETNGKPQGQFYNLNGENVPVQRESQKHPRARYKYHVPYLKINQFRVELTNHNSDFVNKNFQWDIEIHYSQGPRAKIYTPNYLEDLIPVKIIPEIRNFTNKYRDLFPGFQEFQESYCLTINQRKKALLLGPDELLSAVKEFIDKTIVTTYNNESVNLTENPQTLPLIIYISYFILSSIVKEKEGRIHG